MQEKDAMEIIKQKYQESGGVMAAVTFQIVQLKLQSVT